MLSAGALAAPAPDRLPDGGKVVAGEATISQGGNAMVIEQSSDKAIINWDSFSIGERASVNFQQRDASSAALNRVLGNDPSEIYGKLSANGQVFLLNEQGVVFGKGSRVDVGGLVAGTMSLADEDFLSGNYAFKESGTEAGVVNHGELTAHEGFIALLAARVENEGIIRAQLGTVALAGGSTVTLDIVGSELLSVQVEPSAVRQLIKNNRLIMAEGGQVLMTASAAQSLIDTAVPVAEASADQLVANADGSFSLVSVGGDIAADQILVAAGDNGTATVSGALDASSASGKGGRIQLTAGQVAIETGAVLDASGEAGGGEILVGGDYRGANPAIDNATTTRVAAGAELRADAQGQGDGGKVVVWADDRTAYAGAISARGGEKGGDGGRVEVSGKQTLAFHGAVDAGAAEGKAGSLLLDPRNITVSSTAPTEGIGIGDLEFNDNPGADSVINPSTITAVTNTGTAVVLQANNDISIESPVISNNPSGDGGAMTFRAGRSISVESTIYTDNGNVSFVVNDSDANGEYRLLGAAAFQNFGFINSGLAHVQIASGNLPGAEPVTIDTGGIQAGSLTISHAASTGGRVTLNNINILNDVTIDAGTRSADVLNTTIDGAIRVQGATRITTGGNVDIQGANTDMESFGVIANDVTVFDKQALQLGAPEFESAISGNLYLDIVGPLGNAGPITVTGDAFIKANDGGFGIAEPNIDLSDEGNDFSRVIVDQARGRATQARFSDTNDLILGGAFASNLTVTTDGGLRNFEPSEIDALAPPVFASGRGFDLDSIGHITAIDGVNLTAGGSIVLDHPSNDFGRLAITAADAQVVDASDVTLLTSNIAGGYNLSAAGTVTTALNSTITVTGGDLAISAGGSVSFGEDSNIDVNENLGGGALQVTAGGTIAQSGFSSDNGTVTVDGAASFTVTAADSDLRLNEDGNRFAGTVTIATTGVGNYRDVNFRNADAGNAVVEGLESANTLRNVTLFFDNAESVVLPGMSISEALSVDAPLGAITQSAALQVGGIAYFYAGAGRDITLTQAENDFSDVIFRRARNVTLAESNGFNFADVFRNGAWSSTDLTGNLSVTAGGNVAQSNGGYGIRVDGLASFTLGVNNLNLSSTSANQWGQLQIVSANNALVTTTTSLALLTSATAGAFELRANNFSGVNLTQAADATLTTGGNTRFHRFANITLANSGNRLGALQIDDDNSSNYTGTTRITEDDTITQFANWNTWNDSIVLVTENAQAITLQGNNYLGNVTITQQNSGGAPAGAVSLNEDHTVTQGGAWTTLGNTRVSTTNRNNNVVLNNSANVLGDLQISADEVTVVENDTISDFAAWTTGVTRLTAYAGGVSGQGDVLLDHGGNVLGDLVVTAQNATITENHRITNWSEWNVPGTVVLNAGSSAIFLDDGDNILGGIDIEGTPASVLITENHDITQSGAWAIGPAPVTLNARANDILLTESGNVLGNIFLSTQIGTPTSVTITENDTITQGAAWSLAGMPVTLIAENDNGIALTNSNNILGDLTVTGGVVSITENDNLTDGGAWATTGTTTLNAGTTGGTSIVLDQAGNVLGDLLINGRPQVVTLVEDDDLTQAAAWSLAGIPLTLSVSDDHDIVLDRAGNILGDLTLRAGGTGNAIITEADIIGDVSAWNIGGTATLTATAGGTARDIVLDAAGPAANLGTLRVAQAANVSVNGDVDTVQIDAANNFTLTDPDDVDFATSVVAQQLLLDADGHVTQSGAISATGLLLVGDGYATLTHVANDVDNLAAAFRGGDLNFTDADDFAVAVVGGTNGIGIGANQVNLTSVGGTITGLADISESSSALNVATGTRLTLPNIIVAGGQSYTAGGAGIFLTAGIQSTAAGEIAFNSPVSLSADVAVQSVNSAVGFASTVTGANNILTVNAGTGPVNFAAAVAGMGDTGDAQAAINITAGGLGTLFNSTVAANNGIAMTGPVTFRDDVTLANGSVGSIFSGQVTLDRAGGLDLIGYDGLRFSNGLLLASGPALIDSNDSALTFENAPVRGAFDLTLDAGTAQLAGLNLMGADLTALDVTAQLLTIPGTGLRINGAQTFTATDDTNIRLNGNVTSTAAGAITFNSPVSLESAASVTSVDSAIVFNDTLDGMRDLTLDSGAGPKTFAAAVGASAALGDGSGAALRLQGSGGALFASTLQTRSGMTAEGPVRFAGDVTLGNGDTGSVFAALVQSGDNSISGYDGLAFQGGLALTGDLSVASNGGALSLGDSVSGPFALTLDALADGAGTVAGLTWIGTELAGLDITAQTLSLPAGLAISGPMAFTAPGGITLGGALGSAAAPASGAIDFHSAVTLAADSSVTTADAAIHFHDTVDGAAALNLAAGSATVTFDSAVGGATALTDLVIDGGAIALNGGGVATTASQSYNGAVALGAATTLSGTDISFDSTLNGPFALAIAASGQTLLAGTVGGVTPLASLTTDAAGTLLIDAPAITTSGNLNVQEALALGQNLVLTGDGITLGSTVDGGFDLTLNDSGATVLEGVIGGAAALNSLTVDSEAALELPEVTTVEGQTYDSNGAITLTGDLSGTGITLSDVVTVGADGLVLSAGTGTLAFADLLNAGANDLALVADEVDLAGALVGTGELQIRPFTGTQDMTLGGVAGAGLDLTAAEIALLPGTLASLTLGDAAGSGSLAITGPVNLGAADLVLNGMGGISQSGALAAPGAVTLRSNGAIALTDPGNALGDIAIVGAPTSLSLRDSTAITQSAAWALGAAPVALQSDSDITLLEAGNVFGILSLSGADAWIVEGDASDLAASSLDNLALLAVGPIATSGAVSVSGNANLTSLDDAGSAITIGNGSDFGSVSARSLDGEGNVPAAGAITLELAGPTQLDDLVTLGDLSLIAAAGETFSQTEASGILAQGLRLAGAGSFALAAGTNTIATLAGDAAALALRADSGFEIGSVGATAGVTMSGDLVLESSGSVTQSEAIAAGGLALRGASFDLAGIDNDVDTLAADVTGLRLRDADGFAIGSVDGTVGLSASGAVSLSSDGAVTQAAALAGAGLEVLGSGAFTLDHAGNDIATVAGNVAALTLRDDSGFAIGQVNTAGLTTSGTALLISAGAVSQSEALVASGLDLRGAGGDFNLTHTDNLFGTLAADTGSLAAYTGAALAVGTLVSTGVNLSGDLDLVAGGAMTQTAAIAVAGDTALETTHAAGDVAITHLAPTVLGASTVGGDYSLIATGNAVTQEANTAVRVAGDFAVAADALTMEGRGNLIGGVTTTPTLAQIRQSGVITLGDIAETGDYTVISEATTRSFDGGAVHGAAITLSSAGNRFGGSLAVTTGGPAVLEGAPVQTGINQAPGTRIAIGGRATFIAESSPLPGSGLINLINAGNQFGSLALIGTAAEVAEEGGTQLDRVELTESLALGTDGDIGQSGPITVESLGLASTGAIVLTDPGNQIDTLFLLAGGDVSYVDSDGFDIVGLAVSEPANASLTAGGAGDITQSGAITGVGTLTATAGGALILDDATNTLATLGDITAATGIRVENSGGALTVAGNLASGAGDVHLHTEGGDLVLAPDSTLATAGAGNVILAAGAGANFINQVPAPTSPVTLGTGRILIYSHNNALTEVGGISGTSYLNHTYADNAPGSVPGTDNRFLFADQATLLFTATDLSRAYGDSNPTFTYTVTGYLPGDAAGDAFSGAAALSSAATASSDVGVYDIGIDLGTLNSLKGYDFAFADGDLTVTPRVLNLDGSRVYNGSTTIAANALGLGNLVDGQTLSLSGAGTVASANVGEGQSVALGSLSLADGTGRASNYTLAGGAHTVDITPFVINLDGGRTYDGTAAVNAADLELGPLVGDETLLLAGAGSVADRHVADDKAVTLGSLSLADGTGLASNYTLNGGSHTFDIDPAALGIGTAAVSKTYDGGTAAAGSAVVTAGTLFEGDSLSGGTFAFTDANAGTNKTVEVGAVTVNDGNNGNNYRVTYTANTDSTITPFAVDLSGSRVYDGSASAAAGDLELGALVGDETLTLTGAGSLADKHIGADKPVAVGSLALADGTGRASNYTLAGGSHTLSVTAAPLSVSSTEVVKTYDGTTRAAGTAVITSGSLMGGDTLSGGAFAFTDANAGTGKTVDVSAVTISDGNGGNNYAVTYLANTGSVINPFVVDLSGSRVYDGSTVVAAEVLALGALVGDETLGLTGSGSLADKHVGTDKAIGLGSLTLEDGSGLASNYTLSGGSHSVDISARTLTIDASGGDRVYDGTHAASVTLGDNRVAGDDLSLTYASAQFADKHVGVDKTVSVSGIAVTGADAANYSFGDSVTTAADITPRPLAITATGQDRVYDASVTASVTLADNRIEGDELTLGYGAATFADKNVGQDKAIAVTGISASGLDAGNYSYASSAVASADITPAALSVTNVTAVDKVYDGTTSVAINATFANLSGILGGDSVALATLTGVFTDKHVGTDKAVVDVAFTLSGADAGNYALATPAGLSADITPRSLTVTAAGVDKVYDRTTDASVTLADNRIAGDALTLTYSANFLDENVGVGKYVGVDLTLAGADAGNYVYNTSTNTFAAITPRALSVSGLAARDKVYDGTLGAQADTGGVAFDGLISGDELSVSSSAAFTDKHVGSAKPVVLTNVYSGADLGNYAITDQTATTAAITPRGLTVSGLTALDKVYDGTTQARVDTGAARWDGLVAGDQVDLTATGVFADKHVGAAKTVALSSTYSGADAGNYSITGQTSATAAITPRAVTVSGVSAADKVYDGTVVASVDSSAAVFDGVLGGDEVSLAVTGAFTDKNVGIDKVVTLGSDFSGADAGNYILSGQSTTTADITPRALTVSGVSAADKIYDGTVTASVDSSAALFGGVIGGDQVVFAVTGRFSDKHAGDNKTVHLASAFSGADAANYTLSSQASTTASISRRGLQVSGVRAEDKVYDGTTAAAIDTTTAQLNGLIAGDDLALSISGAFTDKNAGSNKRVDLTSGYSGADVNNYNIIDQAATTASITPKRLTATGVVAEDKVYDGSVTATIDTSAAAFSGVVAGDQIQLGLTGTFTSSSAGEDKTVVLASNFNGADAANYRFEGTTAASIARRALTISGITASDKVYDATTLALVDTSAALWEGLLAGDEVALTTTARFVTKDVGADKLVNLSHTFAGDDVNNYAIAAPTTTQASITPRPLIISGITAKNKEFDGSPLATVVTDGAQYQGLLAGDQVQVQATGRFADSAAAEDKLVLLTSTYSGADAGNYVMIDQDYAVADILAEVDTLSGELLANSARQLHNRDVRSELRDFVHYQQRQRVEWVEVTPRPISGVGARQTTASVLLDSGAPVAVTAAAMRDLQGAQSAPASRPGGGVGAISTSGFVRVQQFEPLPARAGEPFSFTLPSDTFEPSSDNAIAGLQARLANGQPLPAWLKFDEQTLTFVGVPPQGQGTLQVVVTARDRLGESASTTLTIELEDDED